jgi:hypothetical protein
VNVPRTGEEVVISTTTEPGARPYLGEIPPTLLHTSRTPVSLSNMTLSTSLGYPTITKTTSDDNATSLKLV